MDKVNFKSCTIKIDKNSLEVDGDTYRYNQSAVKTNLRKSSATRFFIIKDDTTGEYICGIGKKYEAPMLLNKLKFFAKTYSGTLIILIYDRNEGVRYFAEDSFSEFDLYTLAIVESEFNNTKEELQNVKNTINHVDTNININKNTINGEQILLKIFNSSYADDNDNAYMINVSEKKLRFKGREYPYKSGIAIYKREGEVLEQFNLTKPCSPLIFGSSKDKGNPIAAFINKNTEDYEVLNQLTVFLNFNILNIDESSNDGIFLSICISLNENSGYEAYMRYMSKDFTLPDYLIKEILIENEESNSD